MSRIVNDITLVLYDITNNKLRRKIEQAMKDFGVRLQYSVFICCLDNAGVKQCHEKLLNVVGQYSHFKEDTDSVIMLRRIDLSRLSLILGKNEATEQTAFVIV